MTQQRLLGADFLRAAACMMVLLHHLAFRMDGRFIPEAVKPVMNFLVMGSFGVSVFFVLSGYLLARPFWLALDRGEPMPPLGIYALRRAARILPGFWLALVVSLVLSITVSGSDLDGEQIIRFVAGFFLVSDWHWLTLFPVDNNGPLWSIGFEVTSYVLLPFCLAALFAFGAKGWGARLAWVGVIGLVLALHWMVVQWAPIDEVERGWNHGLVGGAKAWMPRFNPIGFFAIFALGALAAGVQVKLATLRHWAFDAIGLLAVVAAGWVMVVHIGGLNEGFGFLGVPYGYPWMPLAIGVALVALPSSVLAGQLLDNRVSRFIAEISFGIYIWHFLVIGLMARLLPPSFKTNDEGGWTIWLWSSAGAIAISVAVATISFYVLERPMVRWARGLESRIGRRKPAPAAV
ncbi:acyltransferase family protein [Devosia sp. SL43]|uniref:acyltransferase family protein n=1 Tax=Devosia sp. SL43 TaxID=2806348 RepID=UPI001F3C5736|nr:acyltransferase [Devosia sp. SL43]UJW85677.1 acyltransferase [Devosia sp. SL43]